MKKKLAIFAIVIFSIELLRDILGFLFQFPGFGGPADIYINHLQHWVFFSLPNLGGLCVSIACLLPDKKEKAEGK